MKFTTILTFFQKIDLDHNKNIDDAQRIFSNEFFRVKTKYITYMIKGFIRN